MPNGPKRFDGHFVVVTGARGGIGLELSKQLKHAGLNVFAALRANVGNDGLETHGIIPLPLDVTDESSIEQATRTVATHVGAKGLHALVNNAGVAVGGPWEHVPTAALRRLFDVNFFGAVAVTRSFLPLLRMAQGRVVNISSVAGSLACPFNGPYSASKSALESFTDSLRQELRAMNVAVSSVQPSAVSTSLWRKFRTTFPPLSDQSLYAVKCSQYLTLTAIQEQKGTSAAYVAAAVCRIVLARNPSPRVVLGPGGRLALRLQALLPEQLQDYLFGLS